jgi:hypothetical protein
VSKQASIYALSLCFCNHQLATSFGEKQRLRIDLAKFCLQTKRKRFGTWAHNFMCRNERATAVAQNFLELCPHTGVAHSKPGIGNRRPSLCPTPLCVCVSVCVCVCGCLSHSASHCCARDGRRLCCCSLTRPPVRLILSPPRHAASCINP